MNFLIDLVGQPEDGMKQTFAEPSKNTMLVNEYIRRDEDSTASSLNRMSLY